MSRRGDKHWSKAEKYKLHMFWPTYPKAEILRMFPNRSWDALGLKARSLGIRRKWKWGGKVGKPRDEVMSQFREARESKDMSAYRLGKTIGADGSFIAKCERGEAGPSYHMIARWCAALGVRIKLEPIDDYRRRAA